MEKKLSEAQLDGRACVRCAIPAREAGPMVPGPVVDGRCTFRCVTCNAAVEKQVAEYAQGVLAWSRIRALEAEIVAIRGVVAS